MTNINQNTDSAGKEVVSVYRPLAEPWYQQIEELFGADYGERLV